MRKEGGYKTHQRDIILELLKNHTEKHMSAEEISEKLRQNGEKVGISTVYRYLEKLYCEGRVQKYTADKQSAKYTLSDMRCRSHFHMKCASCGEFFCADCDFLDKLSEHISGEHGFLVDPSKTIFYGTCKVCSASKQN